VINQASTSTAVASSGNPAVFGQSVTFTATATTVSPGTGTPSGSVQFKIDGVNFGSAVSLNGSGIATSSATTLSLGNHAITATYGGSTNYSGSDNTASPLSEFVNQSSTSTSVASSSNPAVFGQSVTFTATVTSVSP